MEAKVKWTPGDWKVAHKKGVSYIYANTKLADVYSTAFGDEENQVANAALIAAAPDLYEVAQIESTLHVSGFTKATAKGLGPEAEEAYLIGGSPGLNDWRRRKRDAAIRKADSNG